MSWIWHYLKKVLLQFRKSFKGDRLTFHREELWEIKWGLFKDMDLCTEKDHFLIPEMIEIYRGIPVEKVLLLKKELRSIFDESKD